MISISNKAKRALGACLLLALIMFQGVPAGAQQDSRLFPETGKTVAGSFLRYWEEHGGLPQQGYPISDEMQEVSDLDGKTYTVQYFERAVFEHHPENTGSEFEVLLSQLGAFEYRRRYPGGAPGQAANTQDGRLFPETGKSLGGRFRQYWEQNGGLMQQGYPISDEFPEVSALDGKTYTVQYFERAVFEHHPENQPPYDVLLSQLGRFRYQEKYLGGQPAPIVEGFPRYGVDFIGGGGNAAQAQEAVAAGVGLARAYVAWSQIEPSNTTPGNFRWSEMDQRMSTLTAAGLKPIVLFTGCPNWACPSGEGPIDKVSMDEVAEVTGAIAARYSAAPYNIHLWEFWNEPDSTYGDNHEFGWGMHGDVYARMLGAAEPAVRAADPAARIALGGLGYDFFMDGTPPGPFNRQFLRDVVGAGGAAHFDYMNFHYYPQQPFYSAINQKTAKIKELMSELGIDKPIIVTETSLTSASEPTFQHPQWGPSSEAMQSRYLAQSFVQSFASGVQSLTWFNIADWRTDVAGWKIFEETGLLRLDGSRKPVFAAYRTVVDLVGDRPFLRALTSDELGGAAGVEGFAFGGGSELWVLWTTSGAEAQVTLATGGRSAVVKNMYGETRNAAAADGRLSLTLNGEPTYVDLR